MQQLWRYGGSRKLPTLNNLFTIFDPKYYFRCAAQSVRLARARPTGKPTLQPIRAVRVLKRTEHSNPLKRQPKKVIIQPSFALKMFKKANM